MEAPRVDIPEAIRKACCGFKDYRGRSRRSEYWFCILFIIILLFPITLFLYFNVNYDTSSIILSIISIIIIIFYLPLAVRRLHDIGLSGWFILINLVPIVGPLMLLYFFVQDSHKVENKWGPSPKYRGNSDGLLPS